MRTKLLAAGFGKIFRTSTKTAQEDQVEASKNIPGQPDADVVNGGDEGTILVSGSASDTLNGEGGDDLILAGGGADIVDGGAGNDIVRGGRGDDLLIHDVTENVGATDSYNGGAGSDVLRLMLDAATWADPVFQQDLQDFLAYQAQMGQGDLMADFASFRFSAFDLTVRRIEQLEIHVDGVPVSIGDDPVQAVDDAVSLTVEDEEVEGDLGANDIVPDLVASRSILTDPAHGTVELRADGTFTYTPDREDPALLALAEDEELVDSFTYEVVDTDGDTDTATVRITITGSNADPTLDAGTAGVSEDGPGVDVDLAALGDDPDSDDDGTTLDYAITIAPPEGIASISGTTLTYAPDGAFEDLAVGETREVEIEVTATDSHGATAVSIVTVTVTGTNDQPTLSGASRQVSEDGPAANVDLTALADDVDSDDDGTTLSFELNEAPEEGGASIVGGVLGFDPDGDFEDLAEGETREVIIGVTGADSHGAETEEIVTEFTFTVTGENDGPTVAATEAETGQVSPDGGDLILDLTGIGDDVDSDDDGTTLSYAVTGGPLAGTAFVDGTDLYFDAGTDFGHLGEGESEEVEVEITATDSHGAEGVGIVTVTVYGQDDSPTLQAGTAAATEDGPGVDVDLAALGDDPDDEDDGTTLGYAVTGQPDKGSASVDGTVLTFDPGSDFQDLAEGETRDVEVEVTATDSTGKTAVNVVTVTVTGVNDDPTLGAGVAAAVENGPSVDVDLAALGGDADGDDDATTLGYAVTGQPDEGSASVDGTTLTFDPGSDFQDLAAGETRDVEVEVTATDSAGKTAVNVVTVTVTGVNDDPTLGAGVAAAVEDGPSVDVDLAALGGDADGDDDATTLGYAVTGQPDEGSASVDGTTLTFDPGSDFQDLAAGETRDVEVEVTATDSHGATAVSIVTVTVTGTNDAPVLSDGVLAVDENGPAAGLDLATLGDDADSDDTGASLTYAVVGQPSEGTASISGTTLSFDPDGDFEDLRQGQTRQVTVRVQGTDSHGAVTAERDVVVTVTGVNDQPTAITLSDDTVPENVPYAVVGDLSATDADAGDSFSYSIRPGGDGALFEIVGDQLRLGPSAADYEIDSELSVTVRATDSAGAYVDQTLTIDVLDSAELALTTGDDTVPAGAENLQVLANADTLNPGDDLDGGGGQDELVLYGTGTFDLRNIAGFSGFEEVRLVGLGSAVQTLYLRAGMQVDVSASGTGDSRVYLYEDASAGEVSFSGGQNLLYLHGSAQVGTIKTVGNGDYRTFVYDVTAWNTGLVYDGGGSGDQIYFYTSNTTYDLSQASISGVEYVYAQGTNSTVIIDTDAVEGIRYLSGSTSGSFVTGDTTLDLTSLYGIYNVTVGTTNAVGTTFVVDNRNFAFQIRGGDGDDTIEATNLAFSADEIDYIFGTSGIEMIIDSNGTHTAPSSANTFILTEADDTPAMTGADERVNATAATLNSGDSLDGMGGTDTLALYGGGTFNLNTLTSLSNFERLELLGLGSSSRNVYLRSGSTMDVTESAEGSSYVYVQNGTTVGEITFEGSNNYLRLYDTSQAGTITTIGSGTFATYIHGEDAWNNALIYNGGGSSDQLHFYAASTTYDLRSASITGLEYVYAQYGGTVVLIDSATLGEIRYLNGHAHAQFLTEDSTLDLRDLYGVSIVTVGSANVTGTTFTVDNKNIAYQVRGGIGADTIEATNLTFSADELAYIFNAGQVETIIDAAGTHTRPVSATTFNLTTGDDTPAMTGVDERINASSLTLNAGDTLDGAGGTDTLALYGAGSFDLRALAGFTGIEEVELHNFAGGTQQLFLRNGEMVDVDKSGTGSLYLYMYDAAIAGDISFANGYNQLRLQDTAHVDSVTTSGSGSYYTYIYHETSWNETLVYTGGGSNDRMYFYQSDGTYDLRSATITDLEYLQLQSSGMTLLVDSIVLANVDRVQGASSSRLLTEDATLDLTDLLGIDDVTVESSNATGTTFLVDRKDIAFQVQGGTGSDTIEATSLTFTNQEIDYIFNSSSIETIIDASGTYVL